MKARITGTLIFANRIAYNLTNRTKDAGSNLALWIDGVCYGVFSRIRDAMRKYRNVVVPGAPLYGSKCPSWIEAVDSGKLVKSIVGDFRYAN